MIIGWFNSVCESDTSAGRIMVPFAVTGHIAYIVLSVHSKYILFIHLLDDSVTCIFITKLMHGIELSICMS